MTPNWGAKLRELITGARLADGAGAGEGPVGGAAELPPLPQATRGKHSADARTRPDCNFIDLLPFTLAPRIELSDAGLVAQERAALHGSEAEAASMTVDRGGRGPDQWGKGRTLPRLQGNVRLGDHRG